MNTQTTPPRSSLLAKAIAGIVVVAVGAVVVLNGASTFLQDRSPSMAQRLNPLNATARANGIVKTLQRDGVEANTERLEQDARALIKVSPMNGVGYALLGQVRALKGDADTADALFAHALDVSDTNILALQWTLQRAIAAEDYETAADTLFLLTLRWPNTFPSLEPQVLALLGTPEGMTAVATEFRDTLRQRNMLMALLRRNSDATLMLPQLLLKWHQMKAPKLQGDIARIISHLITEGEVAAAHNLFLFTMKAEDQKQLGYVYNSTFEKVGAKGPFNWDLSAKAGLNIGYGGRRSEGLRLEFLNAPTQLTTVRQTLVLHGGQYVLKLNASAEDLNVAAPLAISLYCLDAPASPLARLSVQDGTYRTVETTRSFRVPNTGCAAQRIELVNGVKTLDWKELNSGILTMHSLSILQTEAGE